MILVELVNKTYYEVLLRLACSVGILRSPDTASDRQINAIKLNTVVIDLTVIFLGS